MLVFERSLEHSRYLDETYTFIREEIRYAAQMVAYFERLGLRDARERVFVQSARRYLDSLDASYSAARHAALRGPRTHTEGQLHSFFLKTFPDLIRDLTTALFQRNEAQPPRMVRVPHASAPFAPSEVTLEYPVTIRAAEALNEDYHSRVVHFYDRTYSAPPLVNLSGSTAATLQLREPLAAAVSETEVGEKATMLEQNERTVRHLLNLSCITMPRWSSQHVRTHAFAAHEHMHRALARVHMLVRGALLVYYDANEGADLHADWRSASSVLKDRALAAITSYTAPLASGEGDAPIGELFQHTYALFQRLWDFFQRRKLRFTFDRANTESSHHKTWVKELRRAAWDHAIELLADAGALVIAGPAFAFAYHTVFTPNTARDLKHLTERVTADTPRHPPALLRARLHAAWLAELGFPTISAMLRTASDEEWTRAGSDPHADLLTAYASFVTEDLADTFKRALDAIGGAGGPHSYDLRKRSGIAPAGMVGPEVEERLLKRWEAIARRVESERKYLVDDMSAAVLDDDPTPTRITPADSINAIWWKRIREGAEDPKNRLAWRVALRNSYGSVRL